MRKLYFKKRTTVPLKKYKKQKNNFSKLIKRSVRHILTKINLKKVSDNKSFWKDIKSLFSENRKIRNKIAFADGKENISEEHLVSEGLNNFFKKYN